MIFVDTFKFQNFIPSLLIDFVPNKIYSKIVDISIKIRLTLSAFASFLHFLNIEFIVKFIKLYICSISINF